MVVDGAFQAIVHSAYETSHTYRNASSASKLIIGSRYARPIVSLNPSILLANMLPF